MKIMFVCHGNICRSPMAEFIFKNMIEKMGISHKYEVFSSATSSEELGNPIHYGTRAKLVEKKIPFEERRAYMLKKNDYDEYDMFICMDKRNIRNIRYIFGNDPDSKVSLLMSYAGVEREVADPWYTGNFDDTYRDIVKGLDGLLSYLGEK